MGWKEKMKEFGGGNFTFLSTDGETIIFIVVGEPVLLHSFYKGKEQERIGCPIVTDEGYQLFICGKRPARKISKYESLFDKYALRVVRNGVEGDSNATYFVGLVAEPETFERLKAIKDADFEPTMIQDSVDEATQVLGE